MTEQGSLQIQPLIDAAIAVARNSYAPYSAFRVGSALLLSNGEVITGANVENVSYGLTICAERSAVVTAISRFGPDIRIEAVAVVNLNDSPSPPCGACRQVLAEFIEPNAPITFPAGSKSALEQTTLPFSQLMPYASDLNLK